MNKSFQSQDMWGSQLVRRIAYTLFFVLVLVNGIFGFVSLLQYKNDRLHDLRELGRYTILSAASANQLSGTTIQIDNITDLIETTPISALSYYNMAKQKLDQQGDDMYLDLAQTQVKQDHYFSIDGNPRYEIVYGPEELSVPYYIIAQIDASHIEKELRNVVTKQIIIILSLSLLVTLILVFALSKWLLQPILYLYENLTRAMDDPENPPLSKTQYHTESEIGKAIEAADILMINNAESIKRVKAMAESEVNRLAYYDTLTGLPNRTFFIKTLKETMASTSENFMDRYAVLAMDVDHFKDINDTMGHSVGDEVLKAFATRLAETLPDTAILARSGEDEFAAMLPLDQQVDEAETRAKEVIAAFRDQSISVLDEDFQVRCSIGVAVSPEDSDLPEDVLKCADIALNRAKVEGRDRYKRYEGTYNEDIQKRFQILRDLRVAMDLEELDLYFQPQIDLRSGRLVGAEALIRWWRYGENGLGGHFVSPVDFIPVAEQSGLILPLGDWIMRKACETARSWADDGLGDLRVAVNMSGYQFSQQDAVKKIESIIADTGIKPSQLEIEVTESVFMEDTDHSVKMLKAIQAMGIEIAIDDFGTGYSSLSYLQRFPMDKLKIDRAFVRHLDEQHDNLVLTRTIIALCKTMGLKVVAEGVESKAEQKILIDEGCDYVQGFRYSAPLPDIKFRKLVQNYNGKLDYFD
jgi:diguanylate cyclase (GGDEF)-like protein